MVELSSAGAFLPSGTGPIVGHYETEEKFRAAGKNIVSLRPNEFMENLFFSMPTIIAQGAIYTTLQGSEKAPFIATQDIAEVAAEFLLKPIDGHHVIDIVGPQETLVRRVGSHCRPGRRQTNSCGHHPGRQVESRNGPGRNVAGDGSATGGNGGGISAEYKGHSKAIKNAPAK